MGGKRPDQVDHNYINLDEACELLEATEQEIHDLIKRGGLHAFSLGGQHVRLQKDQVSELKARWRINRNLFLGKEAHDPHVLILEKPNVFERIKDYLYLNNFYIFSSLVVAALIYLIVSSN